MNCFVRKSKLLARFAAVCAQLCRAFVSLAENMPPAYFLIARLQIRAIKKQPRTRLQLPVGGYSKWS